ncbi:MAG: hypothetical protein WCX46_00645 [Candidatus Paceibacterota bacterium]
MQKKEVVCLSCKKTVEVSLVSYGFGHIAPCPHCKQLAYNGE